MLLKFVSSISFVAVIMFACSCANLHRQPEKKPGRFSISKFVTLITCKNMNRGDTRRRFVGGRIVYGPIELPQQPLCSAPPLSSPLDRVGVVFLFLLWGASKHDNQRQEAARTEFYVCSLQQWRLMAEQCQIDNNNDIVLAKMALCWQGAKTSSANNRHAPRRIFPLHFVPA